jgi:hydrogenase maturation protein HypF
VTDPEQPSSRIFEGTVALPLTRILIEIRGLVQGVGFRPFLHRTARFHGCTGSVRNDSSGVRIELQGSQAQLDRLLAEFDRNLPKSARVDSIAVFPLQPIEGENEFRIEHSDRSGPGRASVSADLAVCEDCLVELRDPGNRRYAYPFINCVQCGPRFTIQEAIPYDRQRTTMKVFDLCEDCLREFTSPNDRRFHAQPIACPNCGPTIWFRTAEGLRDRPDQLLRPIAVDCSPESILSIVELVRCEIAAGKIVAIKGIGGFHLACDATNESAVELLRARKARGYKPFAIMVADVETCRMIAECSPKEAGLLQSPQRPIVLLRKKASPTLSELPLSEMVSPDNPQLGVLLPYSPLHHLLIRPGEFWIMTSGNLSDDPISYRNGDAWERLGHLADGFLLHDREIFVPCDDSIVKVEGESTIPIRRSRGYAPQPIDLTTSGPPVFAAGGDQKTAICLATENQAIMSQHLGDTGNQETMHALQQAADHLLSLYPCIPKAIAADLHPAYLSTTWASRWASEREIPVIRVQHHHAHAASLIVEHQLAPDRPIIACVFDGTGFGQDGAIWGGEFLIATVANFRRLGHLKYHPLPGGDACVKQPWRTALGFLFGSGIEWSEDLAPMALLSGPQQRVLKQQLARNVNCFDTSSIGRLFDAVACLIDRRHRVEYEGQAAIELEGEAWEGMQRYPGAVHSYPYHWIRSPTWQLDCRATLQSICQQFSEGVDRRLIAARFHETLAVATLEICVQLRAENLSENLEGDRFDKSRPDGDRREEEHLDTVGLTGGVFQNALLRTLIKSRLEAVGFRVLTHQFVPPNDGGLALGQAAIARSKFERQPS